MPVKCNIASLILDRIQSVNWGVSCIDSNTTGILENYIEHLACKTKKFNMVTDNVDCQGEIVVFNCEYNILRIGFTVENIESVFKVNVGDYIGGTPPFTYVWAFEEDDFDLLSEDLESEELILKIKEGKTFDSLVSQITVTITDANFCSSTKTCVITPQGMQCGNSYELCPNVSNLQVVNKIIQCSGPFALTVERLN